MSNYNYITNIIPFTDIKPDLSLDSTVSSIVNDFPVNSFFEQPKHLLSLEIYSLDNTLLFSDRNYTRYSQLLNSAGAGREGASSLTIDPVEDAKVNDFITGDVNVVYKFLNNPFTEQKDGTKFFIESISSDRTEFRAFPIGIEDNDLKRYTDRFNKKLNDEAYFSEFYIHFSENYSSLGLNVDVESTEKGLALIVKSYKPLQTGITINSTFTIYEIVSDTIAYNLQAELIDERTQIPYLKGPNFNVELSEENKTPTEYLNYNELFSYPVTSSYYELYSLFNEKSAQISIDHSNYEDFIHYSSAEERLRNFKYKLDLIQAYESSINTLNTTVNSTGSKAHYTTLIEGVINNFDHYDRFLYYESGSHSWPKSNKEKPYRNIASTDPIAVNYFSNQIASASLFDNTNVDILTNTIPAYIREDSNNEPYIMFVHMIAQHFDNLWIYFKAVSDKYDTDNRLNFGLSKDLVRSAIESFGLKVENSNSNTGTLFTMYNGEGIVTGSESISKTFSILSGSSNEHLQPVPQDTYQKEIYKRIYHNIPFLVKTKGTQRGLRALINCYGIPEDILSIKTFGGKDTRITPDYGPNSSFTSSLDKVRLDNTGSYITGSTLSLYNSIVKKDQHFSDDQHTVEIGFDISTNTNRHISNKISSSFDIDQIIGDPNYRFEDHYSELDKLSDAILNNDQYNWNDINVNWENADWNWDDYLTYSPDPFAFIRLVKFFDTSLFRTIKQFLPARSNLSTGVIIKPHVLNRNKAKQVQVSYINEIHTGSIQTGFITGSDGDSFGVANLTPYTTNYSSSYVTPLGKIERNITDESPRYTGEFSGSGITITNGELNIANPFKRSAQPNILFDITTFNLSLPIPPACQIFITASYIGEYFAISPSGSGTGTVSITYPTAQGPTINTINYVHDYDTYEYFTLQATATYPSTFDGWYNNSGSLVTASNTLTVYYEDEVINGYIYNAKFS